MSFVAWATTLAILDPPFYNIEMYVRVPCAVCSVPCAVRPWPNIRRKGRVRMRGAVGVRDFRPIHVHILKLQKLLDTVFEYLWELVLWKAWEIPFLTMYNTLLFFLLNFFMKK